MTNKELIEKLQQLPPNGQVQVRLDYQDIDLDNPCCTYILHWEGDEVVDTDKVVEVLGGEEE